MAKATTTTYTATFSDGTTESKNSKAAKGLGFASMTTYANGRVSISFSATKQGLMSTHNANLKAAQETVDNNTDERYIEAGKMSLTAKIVEIVETTTN